MLEETVEKYINALNDFMKKKDLIDFKTDTLTFYIEKKEIKFMRKKVAPFEQYFEYRLTLPISLQILNQKIEGDEKLNDNELFLYPPSQIMGLEKEAMNAGQTKVNAKGCTVTISSDTYGHIIGFLRFYGLAFCGFEHTQ